MRIDGSDYLCNSGTGKFTFLGPGPHYLNYDTDGYAYVDGWSMSLKSGASASGSTDVETQEAKIPRSSSSSSSSTGAVRKVYAYELATHSLHGDEQLGYLVRAKADGNWVWRDELVARRVPFAWESKPKFGIRDAGFQGCYYPLARAGSH